MHAHDVVLSANDTFTDTNSGTCLAVQSGLVLTLITDTDSRTCLAGEYELV